MSYAVEFLPSAGRELAALPKDAQRRLANRIDDLREDPRPPGAKQLQGGDRLYRLRVGDYRVIYSIESRRLVILVVGSVTAETCTASASRAPSPRPSPPGPLPIGERGTCKLDTLAAAEG